MEDYVKDAIDASSDEEVIGLYDRELHLQMLRNTEIYEAGVAGEKCGKKEGKREGILTVAKNLLKNNAPLELIMEVTGLSRKEIENLK